MASASGTSILGRQQLVRFDLYDKVAQLFIPYPSAPVFNRKGFFSIEYKVPGTEQTIDIGIGRSLWTYAIQLKSPDVLTGENYAFMYWKIAGLHWQIYTGS
jgi:hypothetical protein